MNRKKPLLVCIRVVKNIGPVGQMQNEANAETTMEMPLRMVEEVRKVHPNAEIRVEVEV